MPERRTAAPRRHRVVLLWAAGAGILAALAGVVFGLRLSGGTQDDAPDAPGRTDAQGTLSVATWNVCGVRQWNCEDTGSAAEKRARIEALAHRSGARVILLQEMCSEDLTAVRESLGGSWQSLFRPYTAVREGRRSTVRCTGDGRGTAGYGMLSALPLTRVADVPLPQPAAGLRRGILCATAGAEDVRLCTTHLNPQQGGAAPGSAQLREGQLRALVRAASGPRTVFGGDLNTGPPTEAGTDAWARTDGPYSTYRECDQSASAGAPRVTHRSGYKIDYLFTGLPRQGCSVLRSPASDHWALLMRVATG
ncbi:endonuclease/exonuclease/phosphatase family protein [Streptomyces sp. SID8374]|uniref:endonuclease/exonuclease/phosphatase family protein n=1 Tax=Streptomyces sp. SID8374 TaxID=2690354 RepID=UPI0013686E9F|nr:endonuclease/exonuclease/phosphatase family protein [Streptomyces sp. SID8374]MYX17306.1 endonuclease/exonuclease/phosphatase family protein [Streptomyces sp. SID8374]